MDAPGQSHIFTFAIRCCYYVPACRLDAMLAWNGDLPAHSRVSVCIGPAGSGLHSGQKEDLHCMKQTHRHTQIRQVSDNLAVSSMAGGRQACSKGASPCGRRHLAPWLLRPDTRLLSDKGLPSDALPRKMVIANKMGEPSVCCWSRSEVKLNSAGSLY